MLTDVETAAVQILVDRALIAKVEELNSMAERIPNVRALPNALNKAFDKLNDSAGKMIADIEAMGDHGHTVVKKVGAIVTETKATFAEVEKSLEASGTNAGPLSETTTK